MNNKNFTKIVGDDFIATIPEKLTDTTIVTSYKNDIESFEQKVIKAALEKYPTTEKMYSPFTSENSANDDITLDTIDELANGIQSDLSKTLEGINYVRQFIITDDIIGKTQEAIESNLNTNYRLSFEDYSEQRNKNKKLETVKAEIKAFNAQINIERLIRETIPIVHAEGNIIYYLRYNGSSYIVDKLPLGIAYIGDYTYGGNPVVCIDMNTLTSRLQKTYTKNKKNKALFFKNIEDDIKNNYPDEVYQAYKNKENVCILDSKYTGVIRIGNLGRKYGVSPIVRALKSAVMLKNYEATDYITAKAKAKKIIFQKVHKETMGEKYDKKAFEYAIKAHDDLMQAWKQKTVVYTAIPQVESLSYVESKVTDTSTEKINVYRSKIMTTLGIGFIDNNNANFSVANISLGQLMKTINFISEQLEEVIVNWYKVLFENSHIDFEYMPKLQIIDAEAMDIGVRKDLVELLYSKLNCSRETAMEMLNLSIEDERQRRINENENNYDEIFSPHPSQYNSSGDNPSGRPSDSNNTDKQNNDEEYYKDVSK